jgi:hypothetical protein
VSDRSLVQRRPAVCGVSECDREASITRRPWPTRGCCVMEKKLPYTIFTNTIDAEDSGLLRGYRDMSVWVTAPQRIAFIFKGQGVLEDLPQTGDVWQFFLRCTVPCR